MSTMFSAKKASKKFSKRVLGMESLENRELLSVNPLGNPDFTPSDAVQAAGSQDFTTEAATKITTAPTATYKSITVTLSEAEQDALYTELNGDAKLQYQKSGDSDSWSDGGTFTLTGIAVSGSEGVQTVTISSLDMNQLYQLRLGTTDADPDDVLTTGTLSATTISDQSTLDLTTAANSFNKVSFTSGNALVVELTGVPSGVAAADIKFDYTDGGSISNNTVSPTLSGGKYTYSIAGLADGATVTFSNLKIENESITSLSNNTVVASVAPTVTSPTTNATSSASGVTSNAVTLTWTKPTMGTNSSNQLVKAAPIKYVKGTNTTDYKITISDGNTADKVYYSEGKTTIAIPGLTAGIAYTYKVEVTMEDTAKVTLGTQVVTSGAFTTAAEGLGAGVAVGQPIEVKTTPTDDTVKVTWKAPANFTGGYKVTFTDDQTNTFDVFVEAGKKLEWTQKIGASLVLASGSEELKKGDRYEVTVTPIVGLPTTSDLGLSSTPTNFVAQKTQTDPTATVSIALPATPSTGNLLAITVSTKGNAVNVKLAAGKSIPADVDGYWIKLNSTTAPSAISGNDAVADGFIYVTKAQISAGIDVIATSLTSVAARIHAANSEGFETTGEEYTSSVNPSAPAATTTEASVAGTIATAAAGNKITVSWANNAAAVATAEAWTSADTYATGYDVYVSRAVSGPWVLAKSLTSLTASTADTSLKAEITDLEYDTDYYFAVVGTYINSTDTAVAALKATTVAVKSGTAPTVDKAKILTAKSVKPGAYAIAAGTLALTLEAGTGTGIAADQYYIVLRDANKAVIASGFSPVGTPATLSSVPALTPKASYSVEVYGVSGTTIGTKAVKGTLKIDDYPAAAIKADKPSVNGVKVNIEDKSDTTGKFYYVEYTKVADAKGKPDWSTATVEAVTLPSSGKLAHDLAEKLDPNTTYYVRVVTANVNVTITNGQWVVAINANWTDALSVVYGKEAKFKTAAVPLATVGKPGFGLDAATFNMALKTVGQTMLAGKGAVELFDTGKPLAGASFDYTLLVSLDSKVDKNTGQLLGSQAITLNSTDIVIRNLLNRDGTVNVANGEYMLTYALTGTSNILDKLGVTAANYSSIKNLNFQLLTTVTYNSGNTSFDSVTKPGKVAMPKAFV